MTTTAPISTGRERAVTYLPTDLGQRLRTWAALLGLPTSHLLAQVITEATPSRDELAEMVQASAAATAVPGSALQAATAGSASPDVRALMQPTPAAALAERAAAGASDARSGPRSQA